MSLSIEIQKKPNKIEKEKQIYRPIEVFNLEEVQEIKDAIQEHLLFIGLDRGNNIRNISLLGVGSSSEISVNCKDILRTALMSASDKVILVHNHPSNSLNPSNQDRNMTNTINKFLKVFNIELLDHIIVAENNYISMGEINAIDKEYENDMTKIIDNALLIEENNKLKQSIDILFGKLQKYEKAVVEYEEEFE